jgi:hypothetical protein
MELKDSSIYYIEGKKRKKRKGEMMKVSKYQAHGFREGTKSETLTLSDCYTQKLFSPEIIS